VVRSAFAKGLGVSEDKVTVDYDTKMVSVDMGSAEVDKDALTAALESTKYSLGD
jgi:hypothetical protein